MAHPNVELLNKGYDAFEKGDLDALRELFTEDVVFHTAGRNPISGDHEGIDAVFAFFGKVFELSGGTFKLERHAVLADDEHATVLSTATGERDGKRLSVRGVDVFHVRDGRVSECWNFVEDQYADDEFWS
jgi:ketosteroid isomerase-like protein